MDDNSQALDQSTNTAATDTINSTINSAINVTMNNQEALNIIQTLSDGLNPLSDEPLAENSLCLNSDIQRALQTAIPALESRIRSDLRRSKLPANAGKPWNDEEDQQLLAAFDEGSSIAALVEAHQRTKGSISSRLLKFGKMVD